MSASTHCDSQLNPHITPTSTAITLTSEAINGSIYVDGQWQDHDGETIERYDPANRDELVSTFP